MTLYPNEFKIWEFGEASAVNLKQRSGAEAAQLEQVERCKRLRSYGCCFVQWVRMITDELQGVIAIDGKTICNSGDAFSGQKACHIVTAFEAENDIILGQLKTAEK